MKVEEIAVRQEVRQLLSEAGINRETIREMAKLAIQEAVNKQINFNDIPYLVNREVHDAVRDSARVGCREAAKELLNGATISIQLKN